jgi:hypothetical protein
MRAAGVYPEYLKKFYREHLNVQNMAYQEHMDEFFYDSFADGNFLEMELRKLGVEAETVLFDENLQKKWREDFADKSIYEIFLEQLKEYQPDVLWFQSADYFSAEQMSEIRSVLPKHAKMVLFSFSNISDEFFRRSACFDEVYTGGERYARKMRENLPSVKVLSHAFPVQVLDRIQAPANIINSLSFAGSFMFPIHGARMISCAEVIDAGIPLDVSGDVYNSYLPHTWKQKLRGIVKPRKLTPGEEKIRDAEKIVERVISPGMYGLEYYKFLAEHTVCLNGHIQAGIEGTAGNVRMFESTGVGACLLTNRVEENKSFFEPDIEIMEYSSKEELVEKARWLIDNPKEAQKIAKAGQTRTLIDHTYKNKAEQLDEYLCKLLQQ